MSRNPIALTARSQVDTAAFRAWFGDSKVVDRSGRPLVVYHGTGSDIGFFDPTLAGKNFPKTGGKYGLFFTANPSQAGCYATGASPNVVPVFVSLQNPLVIEISDGDGRHPDVHFDRRQKSIKRAVESGLHDGVIIGPYITASGYDSTLVVAFRAEQVKSAIGNNGLFSLQSPDIRCSTVIGYRERAR